MIRKYLKFWHITEFDGASPLKYFQGSTEINFLISNSTTTIYAIFGFKIVSRFCLIFPIPKTNRLWDI